MSTTEEIMARTSRMANESMLKTIDDLRAENASLREQIRLANDKMAEQVRQARWEVAVEIISSYASTYRDHFNLVMEIAHKIRDANAPKE